MCVVRQYMHNLMSLFGTKLCCDLIYNWLAPWRQTRANTGTCATKVNPGKLKYVRGCARKSHFSRSGVAARLKFNPLSKCLMMGRASKQVKKSKQVEHVNLLFTANPGEPLFFYKHLMLSTVQSRRIFTSSIIAHAPWPNSRDEIMEWFDVWPANLHTTCAGNPLLTSAWLSSFFSVSDTVVFISNQLVLGACCHVYYSTKWAGN